MKTTFNRYRTATTSARPLPTFAIKVPGTPTTEQKKRSHGMTLADESSSASSESDEVVESSASVKTKRSQRDPLKKKRNLNNCARDSSSPGPEKDFNLEVEASVVEDPESPSLRLQAPSGRNTKTKDAEFKAKKIIEAKVKTKSKSTKAKATKETKEAKAAKAAEAAEAAEVAEAVEEAEVVEVIEQGKDEVLKKDWPSLPACLKKRLGEYVLDKIIAINGSTADVYAASKPGDSQGYALKVYRQVWEEGELVCSEDLVRLSAQNELKMLKLMKKKGCWQAVGSENLISWHGYIPGPRIESKYPQLTDNKEEEEEDKEEEDLRLLNEPVLVFEKGEESLHEMLTRRAQAGKRLGLTEIVNILTQVVAGTHNLHQAGIMHGSLAPRNIIRKGALYKLSDFGDSALIGDPTQPEAEGGSPRTPPEGRSNTAQRDLWGLGVLILELTSTLPLVGLEGSLHLSKSRALLSVFVKKKIYPRTLLTLADSLLKEDPSLRPTTSAIKKSLLF